jgi:hypothetical protein
MRSLFVRVAGTALAGAALAAVVATVTVQYFYPRRPAITSTAAAPVTPSPILQTVAQPVTPPPTPQNVTQPVTQPPSGPEEQLALDLLRRAAAGDLAGALELVSGLTEESLRNQVTRHSPTVRRIARLPGPQGATRLLVWADYRLAGMNARGAYDLTIRGGKVTDLTGPLTPDGGYVQPSLQPQDEAGRPVDLTAYAGKALLLVSPRAPEPGLPELLNGLQATYSPRGIAVVLVMDIRAPDWLDGARQGGWEGPVWRIKSRLEDVPLVSRATLLGAYGVLVDPDGYAVASLAALDPLRYDLPDLTPIDMADTVLQAYGLLP